MRFDPLFGPFIITLAILKKRPTKTGNQNMNYELKYKVVASAHLHKHDIIKLFVLSWLIILDSAIHDRDPPSWIAASCSPAAAIDEV